MSDRIHVLFVCSRNQWRSPTAEAVFRDDPRVAVRSRGTAQSAVRKIGANDLDWADVVMVMEDQHRKRLAREFPELARERSIHVLDIPDEYRIMDPDLINLIRASVEPIIESEIARRGD